jgi:methylated-DNA-[protein]-cysteine S-methyltransferase
MQPKRTGPTVTDFQKRVYDAIRKIPKGKVLTYKAVAQKIHCGSARAVGQALKKNPFAPEVPCHRVVASDLSLTGYFGATEGEGIRKKARLLKSEGVSFDARGRVLPNYLAE